MPIPLWPLHYSITKESVYYRVFLENLQKWFFHKQIKNPPKSRKRSAKIFYIVWHLIFQSDTMTKPRKKREILLLLRNKKPTLYWKISRQGIVFGKKIRMHFVPSKVPWMNSFGNLANKFIIENLKQNRAAENGSGAKIGYSWVSKAVRNIFYCANWCLQKN